LSDSTYTDTYIASLARERDEHLAARRELIARCIELGDYVRELASHIARRSGDGTLMYPHASFEDCPTCQLATDVVSGENIP
jgi:hypothetical protein